MDMVGPPPLVELLVRHVLLPREFLPQIEINSDDSACHGGYDHFFLYRVDPHAGHDSGMTMGSGDLRDVDWVLTNRITEWHREHYLCSTTIACTIRLCSVALPCWGDESLRGHAPEDKSESREWSILVLSVVGAKPRKVPTCEQGAHPLAVRSWHHASCGRTLLP
jgi:hypothetical protein